MSEAFDMLFYLFQTIYSAMLRFIIIDGVSLLYVFIVIFALRLIIVNLISLPRSVPDRFRFVKGGVNSGKSEKS